MVGATRSSLSLAVAGVWVLAALAEVAPAAEDAELRVTARLQPDVIAIDELVRFTIEVEGGGFGSRGFQPQFELENLEVVNGPSESKSFRFVNGVASRSESLSWILRPAAIGPARAHSIAVEIGDTVFEPADAVIEVVEDASGRGEPPPPQRSRDPFAGILDSLEGRPRARRSQPKVFLRAGIEPRDPFVGQQALYTLYLYTQVDVTSINPERLPDFNGFWVREIEQGQPAEIEMVDVDGERFGRVPVLRRAVFPLRDGELELEPAKVQLSIRVPDRTFGSMFSQTDQIRRDSNAVKLTARALPTAPPEFAGAVGDLSLVAELEPAQVAIGDAATFKVTLSGAGHIQGLAAPTLPELQGLRSFPPEQENGERVVGNRVRGRRSWSFVLVPQEPGVYELPAIEIPYFDPERSEFLTATASPARLEVTAAAPTLSMMASAAVHDAVDSAVDDGQGVAGTAAVAAGRWMDWRQVLPWTLVAMLMASVLVLLARGRRHGRGGGQRATSVKLEDALRAASSESKPRRAAALIEEGWRRLLEERWGIPPGVASTQWGRHLADTEAPPETAAALVALADDLHYLRYAPQLADTASLTQELILRSQKLSRTLK